MQLPVHTLDKNMFRRPVKIQSFDQIKLQRLPAHFGTFWRHSANTSQEAKSATRMAIIVNAMSCQTANKSATIICVTGAKTFPSGRVNFEVWVSKRWILIGRQNMFLSRVRTGSCKWRKRLVTFFATKSIYQATTVYNFHPIFIVEKRKEIPKHSWEHRVDGTVHVQCVEATFRGSKKSWRKAIQPHYHECHSYWAGPVSAMFST